MSSTTSKPLKLGLAGGALLAALVAAFAWLLLTPRAYEADLGTPVALSELEPQGPLPGVAITTLDGVTYTNADLAGKVTVLHFWGTHCGPCVQELPALREEYRQVLAKRDDLTFIGLANNNDLHTLERFIASRGVPFPVAAATDEATLAVWSTLGIQSTPSTVIVDPLGRIRWVGKGTKIPGNLRELIGHLAQESGSAPGAL
jgi:peroxiredoxin